MRTKKSSEMQFYLLPMVPLNDDLGKLVKEVREVRAKNVTICHSAQPGVDVPGILMEIVDKETTALTMKARYQGFWIDGIIFTGEEVESDNGDCLCYDVMRLEKKDG